MTAIVAKTEAVNFAELEPECDRVPHVAKVAFLCRQCRWSLLLCDRHSRQQKRRIWRWLRTAGAIQCRGCGKESTSFDEAIELVTIRRADR